MRIPKYRRNGDGRAFAVYPNSGGKREYFGVYGTAEAKRKYDLWLAKLLISDDPTVIPSDDPTIAELVNMYLAFAESYYPQKEPGACSATEYENMIYALRPLFDIYGDNSASTIGPSMLIELQKHLAKSYPRSVVNNRISRVKRFVKWCAANEHIKPETYASLLCVEGLRPGRYGVRESKDVKPVPREHVTALLPFVSPPIAAMIRVQFYCGMRPQDVTSIKGKYVERDSDVWLYRPPKHKMSYRGICLVKAILPPAQEIIEMFWRDDPEEFIFRPADAMEWHAQNRPVHLKSERSTPVFPSELKARERAKVARAKRRNKRQLKDHYSTASYRRAVSYGITRAGRAGVDIPHWHPHQLRHSIATEISQRLSEQAAQVWLGHSDLETTGIYAERQVGELIDIANKLKDMLPEL